MGVSEGWDGGVEYVAFASANRRLKAATTDPVV